MFKLLWKFQEISLEKIQFKAEEEQKKPSEVFLKKGVLRNFAKITEKHLCQSLYRTPPDDCVWKKKLSRTKFFALRSNFHEL